MFRAALGMMIVMALVAAGCGGSSDDDSTTEAAASSTKAAFVAQGDRICKRATEEKTEDLEAAFAKQNESQRDRTTQAEEEKLLVLVALPPVDRMSKELGELELPADDPQASAIVTDFQRAVAEVKADPKAVVTEQNEPFAKVLQEADAYGFKNCSEI